MKILVTGALGYVGSEISRALQRRGHDVWPMGRGFGPSNASVQNWIEHDLTTPITSDSTDFDLIVHAAGANDIVSRDAEKALMGTVLTTKRIIDFARRQHLPRLLYISTIQVLGRNHLPVTRDLPPAPSDNYGFTHLIAEQWIQKETESSELQSMVVRLGNISGVPSDTTMRRWTLVPGCFCKAAFESNVIVLKSNGLQTRDFLTLSDVSTHLTAVAERFEEFNGMAVNLLSGHTFSIGEVADWVAQIFEERYAIPCKLIIQGGLASEDPVHHGSNFFDVVPEKKIDRAEAELRIKLSIAETFNYLEKHNERN
jgi:UDP-glucose 4-epimerase